MSKQLKSLLTLCSIAAAIGLAGCIEADGEVKPDAENTQVTTTTETTQTYTREDLDAILADPIARSELVVKVMGTTERADTHAYLYFHVYGFSGEGNIVPFFTMHNYIVQKWTPVKRGTYELKHYEVAYYAEFDTQKPLENWVNPITKEENDVPTLILGPIPRTYTPEGIVAMGVAPNPLSISLVGDRLFIPTQSSDQLPNPLAADDWGQYSIGPTIFWDSMLTYSTDLSEALNPETSRARSEIHMQNLVSWSPNLQMGRSPGRSMVRAFGQHINGPEDIPKEVHDNLLKYAPEIFDTDNWTEFRMDTIDYLKELQEKRAAGELVIEPLDSPLE